MNTTPNINLSTYTNDPNDKFNLMVTFNENMNKIDTAVGAQNDEIDVIGQTANSALSTANTASATATNASTTATQALDVANSKPSINDTVAGATSTYSSNKIDELISGAGGTEIDDSVTTTTKTWSSSKINIEIDAVINDTTPSNTTTYSSNKIDDLVGAKASINDTTPSNTTTYSSNKIDDLVGAKASINDTTASSSTTYSSTKINNLLSSKLNKNWSLLLNTSFTTSETNYTISNLTSYTDLVIELEHSTSTADSCFIPDALFISSNRVVLNDFSIDNTSRWIVNIQYVNSTTVKIWSTTALSDYTIRIYGR